MAGVGGGNDKCLKYIAKKFRVCVIGNIFSKVGEGSLVMAEKI